MAGAGLGPVPFPAAARVQLEVLALADPVDEYATPRDLQDLWGLLARVHERNGTRGVPARPDVHETAVLARTSAISRRAASTVRSISVGVLPTKASSACARSAKFAGADGRRPAEVTMPFSL